MQIEFKNATACLRFPTPQYTRWDYLLSIRFELLTVLIALIVATVLLFLISKIHTFYVQELSAKERADCLPMATYIVNLYGEPPAVSYAAANAYIEDGYLHLEDSDGNDIALIPTEAVRGYEVKDRKEP